MERILLEIMPKDIVYMIQEYSRDTDKKQDVEEQLQIIFHFYSFDRIGFHLFGWSHKDDYTRWYNQIIYYAGFKIKPRVDRKYIICAHGDCPYNTHYYGYCQKHSQVTIKTKRFFKRVLNQLNKHIKLKIPTVYNYDNIYICKAKRKGIMITNGNII